MKTKSEFQSVNPKSCNSEDPCWPADSFNLYFKSLIFPRD